MQTLKIVNKSVAELIPYANNPRDNEAAVDAVASSIENFGFKNPIIIDKNNEIIAGHTRLLAAKKLDMEEVPTIVADDLSGEQIKAFRLADNKVSELAEWDEEALAIELEELENLDFDMSEFGFEELEDHEQEMLGIDDEQIGDGLSDEHVLMIDGTKVLMTERETEQLQKLLDQYIDCNGVSFGFVGDLLCNI